MFVLVVKLKTTNIKTMKSLNSFLMLLFFITFTLLTHQLEAQRGHSAGHSAVKTKVIVKNKPHRRVVVRSRYRPSKLLVFHPYWAPQKAYNRRWIFFPKLNLYWDNWRQMYAYKNGTIWIMNATLPSYIENKNILDEKSYELKELEDEVDDVYEINDLHKTEYKIE